MAFRPARATPPLAWPAFAALAPVAVALIVRGCGATLAWRDTGRILAPVRTLVVDALRHGRLPLWNPFNGAGSPILGDAIHGVLHPLSIVAALFGEGVDLLILLYLAAAGLGGYLAGRAFGASRPASAAAGISYAASGVVLGTSSLVQCLPGAAMLPWVAAAARRTGAGAPLGVPFLAAAMAATILGGDAQGAVVASATTLIIAAEAGGRAGLLRAGAGLGLGYLCAGIQILPTWGVMRRSPRVFSLDDRTLHQWALHPWRLLELVVPGLVGGRPGPDVVSAFVTVERESRFALPFLPSVFVGAPVIVAAAAGTPSRTRRTLVVLGAIVLWLSLGHRLGAQQALSWVPVWSSFRYAEKMVPHLALFLALLAATGADAIAEDAGARRRAAAATLALTAAVALLVEGFIRTVSPGAPSAEDGLRTASRASGGLLYFTASIAATGAWIFVARSRPSAAAPFLAAVAAIQGALTAPFSLYAMPRESLRSPPPLEAPPPGPRLATPHFFWVERDRDPDALARLLALESAAGAVNYNARQRLDNVDVAGALMSRRFEYLWNEFGDDRWVHFRRYGVTHLATPRKLPPAEQRLVERAAGGLAKVVEHEGVAFRSLPHRPWAFFASSARAVPSQLDTLAATREEAEADSSTVVLEASRAPPLAAGRILAIDRRTERVTIDAEADGDGLLVVNDAFFPGWSATIDGVPVQILPADVLVRAIPFPAGRHRLEMRYAPVEVSIGIGLTALGTAVCLVWILAARALPGRSDGTLRSRPPGAATSSGTT